MSLGRHNDIVARGRVTVHEDPVYLHGRLHYRTAGEPYELIPGHLVFEGSAEAERAIGDYARNIAGTQRDMKDNIGGGGNG